jgi:hypothetical protein
MTLMPPRGASRRGRRNYFVERAAQLGLFPSALPGIERAQVLLGAAPRQAAIKRALRAAGIDFALARLVVLFADGR